MTFTGYWRSYPLSFSYPGRVSFLKKQRVSNGRFSVQWEPLNGFQKGYHLWWYPEIVKVCKTQEGWATVPKHFVIFVCPKIDEFRMTLCTVYIGWLTLTIHFFLIWSWFCTVFFPHHSSTLQFLPSIKHGILMQSSI